MVGLRHLLVFNLPYSQSSLAKGLVLEAFVQDFSLEKLELQELIAAPLLAFVSTGNKDGTPMAKWAMGQLSLALLRGRLRLETSNLELSPTASLSGPPGASCLWLQEPKAPSVCLVLLEEAEQTIHACSQCPSALICSSLP